MTAHLRDTNAPSADDVADDLADDLAASVSGDPSVHSPVHRPGRQAVGLALAVSGLLCGLGCGPDAPTTTPDAMAIPEPCLGDDIAAADAWACVRASVCAVYAPCFAGAMSGPACEQLDADLFGLGVGHAEPLVAGALAAGTVSYDGQELGRCLADIRALSCADIFAADVDPFAVCQPYTGTVSDQGQCVLHAECAVAGGYCERTGCADGDACCLGQCASPKALDEPCAGDIECGPSAYCVAGTCADGSVGARCAEHAQCDSDNYCDGAACVADRASGAACEADAQCPAPETCVGRNLPAGGMCARSLATGDPCAIACRSFFSHYCEQPDPSSLGTCQPRVEAGTLCTSQVMPCQIHMTCAPDSNACAPSGDVGDPCQNSINCQFFRDVFCSTELDGAAAGECLDRQPDGAACADDSHCLSGLCHEGTCLLVESCY